MKANKTKYPTWTLIDWDGNSELGLKCYRKSFGKGYVSIGVGDFTSIVYSHGHNSDKSLCSTRWRKDSILTPEQAMKIVDKNKGYHNPEKSKRNESK